VDPTHCHGCEDDFYNDKNPYGVKACWSLKDAKVIARFEISVHAPMGTRRNYQPVQRPQCYRQKGVVFVKEIPSYAD